MLVIPTEHIQSNTDVLQKHVPTIGKSPTRADRDTSNSSTLTTIAFMILVSTFHKGKDHDFEYVFSDVKRCYRYPTVGWENGMCL